MTPQNRPLKLLFTACSPMDVKPELDFKRLESIQRMRYELLKNFSGTTNPAWPILRLFDVEKKQSVSDDHLVIFTDMWLKL